MARICQRAENRWVGVNCGIMDQMISAGGKAGHALFIDCRSLTSAVAPIPDGFRIIVLDSAAPRTLAGSAYNQRRAECESSVAKLQAVWPEIRALRDVTPEMLEAEQRRLTGNELRRSRHVVSENGRAAASVEVLRRGDAEQFGRMMIASHESLRDDYEVSSRELDALVELSLATPGVLGARLTGAGFGGCAIALAAAEKAHAAAESVIAAYRAKTGRAGAAFVTSAGDGASVVGR
jgi:galactokinase